jgi:hypothetical protein
MSLRYKSLLVLGAVLASLCNLSGAARAAVLWTDDPTEPASNGDLSNDRLNPTPIPTLMQGDNFLNITIDNPENGEPLPDPTKPVSFYRDLEYFVITVPKGLVFSKLILSQYGGGTSDDVAFIGMQKGTQFTEPPQPASIYDPTAGTTNPANLLGYALFGNKTTYGINDSCNNVNGQNLNGTPLPPGAVVQVGQDLLPIMGNTTNRPDTIQPNNCLTFAPPSGFTAPLTAGDYVFWVQQTAAGDTKFTLNFVTATVPEPASVLGLLAFGAVGTGLLRKGKS